MKEHMLNLDRPRKLHYGFKALRIIKEKYGENKDLTDVMNASLDEIPFFAYAGLIKDDEKITVEKVEELLEETIPEKYTVLDIIFIITAAIADHVGVKVGKKKVKKKKKTASLSTVKSRSD